MQRLFHIIMLFTFIGLTACQDMASEQAQLAEAGIQLGEKYYTQVTIQYEKGRARTTNYRRGILIGVNTPVEVVEISRKAIKVKLLPDNRDLLIENVTKHTGDNVYQAFDKLFAKTKVNLSKFSPLEQKNIKSGTVAKGMSKAAVKVAIGYPPATRTPSLDSDEWVYWSNRFNTFIVYFSNGRVTNIKD